MHNIRYHVNGETLIPLLLFVVLFKYGNMDTTPTVTSTAIFDVDTEELIYVPYQRNASPGGLSFLPVPMADTLVVGFTPNNSQTRRITDIMRAKWMMASNNNMELIGFESDAVMEKYFLNEKALRSNETTNLITERKFAGIVFNIPDLSSLSYTLRGPSSSLPSTMPPYVRTSNNYRADDCRMEPDDVSNKTTNTTARKPSIFCDAAKYGRRGILALQAHLSLAYIELSSTKKWGQVKLFTRMMPRLASKLSTEGEEVRTGVPAFCMTVILGSFICFLVSTAVAEKESGLLSNMKVMGLQPAVYWLSWSVLYFALMSVVAVLCVLSAKALDMWSSSNLFLMFIYCLLYISAMIAVCWCVVPLVRRPLFASMCMFIVVLTGAFMFLINMSSTLDDGDRWGLGFIPSAAFATGIIKATGGDLHGFGIGFENAFSISDYTFGASATSLLIDILLFGLFAVYLDKVFPSDDISKQPPWFFCIPSYWSNSRQQSVLVITSSGNIDIEMAPLELRQKAAVISHNLRKEFSKKIDTAAVEDFTYEIYEDEVLAVLGHNGAGKTTLLNMLAGLLKPTSGHALVHGQDLSDPQQLKIAQTMIGFCPQQDVLFDTLTVKEHIIFYTRLKGYADTEAEREYERIIDCIDMRGQADNTSQTLSGGQKRRLCIAIAITGNPEVLILDEPTSGVDPFTRHFIWDMIRGYKTGRCVIITTHSMQEADIYCDRKLIFSHGKIRCAGSSLFLKGRFGAGYHLTMSMERAFDEKPVVEFITSRIPSAKVSRVHGGEISFVLLKETVVEFPNMLSSLDENLPLLKIQSYGVTETSLEEIFLMLAENGSKDVLLAGSRYTTNLAFRGDVTPLFKMARQKSGSVPNGVKFIKLCKIRFLIALRSKIFCVFHLILPLSVLIAIGMLLQTGNSARMRSGLVDNLPMIKVGDALRDTGTALASNEHAEKNFLVGSMEALVGQRFDKLPYDQLNHSAPHYLYFDFSNGSSALSAEPRTSYAKINAGSRTFGLGAVPDVTLVYDESAVHVLPYAANILLSALFCIVTGKQETFDFAIHPFPNPLLQSHEDEGGLGMEHFFIGFMLLLIPGIYCVDICRDRTLKLRSQIRMTGCSAWLYWASALASHFVQFGGTFALTIIMMYAFKVTNFTDNISVIVLLFSLHAPAAILFCYCLSFAFRKHKTALAAVPLPLAVVGISIHLIRYLSRTSAIVDRSLSDDHQSDGKYDIPHYVCVFLFPFYGFLAGLMKLDQLKVMNRVAKEAGKPELGGLDWESDVPVVLVAVSRDFKMKWCEKW